MSNNNPMLYLSFLDGAIYLCCSGSNHQLLLWSDQDVVELAGKNQAQRRGYAVRILRRRSEKYRAIIDTWGV
jgi:hypothetical protein